MGGEKPAVKNGATASIAHDQSTRANIRRVYANVVGQLETGGCLGKVSFTRNASGRISAIVTEYPRPEGTETKTRTITRNASGRISAIEEAT